MSKMTSEMARQLLEIGIMAAWRGDTVDARTILGGVEASRSGSPYPDIGLAVSYMNEGRYRSAVDVLKDALEKDKECDLARVHLALAYKLTGFDARSRNLCEDVVDAARDDVAIELALMLNAVPGDSMAAVSIP